MQEDLSLEELVALQTQLGEAEDALVEIVRTAHHLDVPGVHYADDEDKGLP